MQTAYSSLLTRTLMLCIGLLTPLMLLAQQNGLRQTVRGKVLDKDSKAPLFGAHVKVINTDPLLGASTDVDGQFRITEVPVGRQNLEISALGYEKAVLSNVLIGSGKELVLTIELVETVTKLKEVVVTGKSNKDEPLNPMASVSARSFSVEETKRYAAAVNDPARMALNYAGVTAAGDESNEIVIRGNSPKGLLWRLEGVEIPNPNHFAQEGSSGGGISILSAQMLSNSDFFTGAFPAEYGNASSGVFDIRLRQGNNEQREFTVQAGVLGLDFAAEGPFVKGKRSSFLLNYRYSTLAILDLFGVQVAGDAVPTFQDLSFKFNFPTSKAGNFSLWGISGLSESALDSDFERETFQTNMGATGLSHHLPLDKKSYLKTVVSFSGTSNLYKFEPLNFWGDFELVDEERFENTAIRSTTSYTRKFNARHLLKMGVIHNHLMFLIRSREYKWPNGLEAMIDENGLADLFQGYAAWQYRPGNTVTINAGMHTQFLELTGRYTVEPRLGLRWTVDEWQTVSFGFGMHSRMEDPATYLTAMTQLPGLDITFYPNRALRFAKAMHYVVGYERSLSSQVRLKLESYYQRLFDVPVAWDQTSTYSLINENGIFNANWLISDGTGTNYGLEMTLERFFSSNYYFLLTAAVYNSKYEPYNGETYNTRFNGNHSMNFLAGREFPFGEGRKNLFGVNMKFNWNGGMRYTPILLSASREAGREILDPQNPYGEKAEDYLRLDLQMNYRKNRSRTTHEWRLDIQNVTNRLNTFSYYYDAGTGNIERDTQLGLIPVLSYRVQF